MNIGVHVSFPINVFIVFQYIPRSGISESYGSSIFSFLRTSTLFSTVAAQIYIPTNRVPLSPYPHVLFVVLLIIVIMTGERWYLSVVSICVSLKINDEHLFLCLLFSCMSSLEKCLFRSSTHFLIRLFVSFDIELYELFMLLMWIYFKIYLDINLLSVISFTNIFSHSVGFLFVLSVVSFAVPKLLSLLRFHLFIFVFISFALGDRSKIIVMIYVKKCSAYVFF